MRVITLDINKKVTSAKSVGESYVLKINEIKSDTGEIDQIMQTDGSFIDVPTPIVPAVPQPTNQEIYDNQMAILRTLNSLLLP